MSNRAVYRLGWLATLPLLASGCAATGSGSSAERDITNVLGRQVTAWNTGDLDAFMEPYWHSPYLTFSSGGTITRGWQAMKRRYLKNYPTRDDMGTLSFSELEIQSTGADAAFVLGRWRLDFEQPVGGVFTLVLRRILGDWVIVHDNTWRDEP